MRVAGIPTCMLFASLACALPAGAACLGGTTAATTPLAGVTALRSYSPGLRTPTRLAVGPADRVYITDPAAGQVVVRADDGRVLERRSGFGTPLAIAVNATRIYVGDATGTVTAYDSAWNLLHTLGSGAGEFGRASDLALDGSGMVYVADTPAHHVRVYDSDGVFVRAIGTAGTADGQLQFPSAVHVDVANAEVAIADHMNYRVQYFDLTGTFLRCIGRTNSFSGARQFDSPQGLWIDAGRRLFVADSLDGNVKVVNGTSGANLGVVGRHGSAPGELRIPMDVVADTHGRLYVAASDSARLELYGIDAYTDPEQYLPAAVFTSSAEPLSRLSGPATVSVHVEIAGNDPGTLNAAALTVNGLYASSFAYVDQDQDNRTELRADLDRALLLATLDDGANTVTVAGTAGALSFSEALTLTVGEPAGPLPVVLAADASVPEGDGSATLEITFTLSAAYHAPVSFDYATLDHNASAGSDYGAISGTVTLPAGSTTATVAIPILGDTDTEGDESFELRLSDPGNAVLATATLMVYLNDDDPLPAVEEPPPTPTTPGGRTGKGWFGGALHPAGLVVLLMLTALRRRRTRDA